jgi:hypothetical protein
MKIKIYDIETGKEVKYIGEGFEEFEIKGISFCGDRFVGVYVIDIDYQFESIPIDPTKYRIDIEKESE